MQQAVCRLLRGRSCLYTIKGETDLAVFKVNIKSQALYAGTTVNVILPLPGSGDYNAGKAEELILKDGEKYAVLYLLHGMYGDSTNWIRSSNIERYAARHRIAVVMPEGYNSFYNDIPYGSAYFTYLTKELPRMMQSLFPISAKREYNYIAGLSMGGFGAAKAALSCPDQYAASISLSGSMRELNPEKRPVNDENRWFTECYGVGGKYFDPQTQNLKIMLKNLMDTGADIPRLYVACGTEDFLYDANVEFRDFCAEIGYPLKYEEGPGVHDWVFWDHYIQRGLDWIGLPGKFVD